MTASDRRRYFRINDTIGLSIKLIDKTGESHALNPMDPMELICKGDEAIEQLIRDAEVDNPQLAQLASLLNQKMERVANLLALESELLQRIASRTQEVNISACGVAFEYAEALPLRAMLELVLTLLPTETVITTRATVLSCEPGETQGYWCRLDFVGMDAKDQEYLIQHIVQNQGAMLKLRAENK